MTRCTRACKQFYDWCSHNIAGHHAIPVDMVCSAESAAPLVCSASTVDGQATQHVHARCVAGINQMLRRARDPLRHAKRVCTGGERGQQCGVQSRMRAAMNGVFDVLLTLNNAHFAATRAAGGYGGVCVLYTASIITLTERWTGAHLPSKGSKSPCPSLVVLPYLRAALSLPHIR